MANPVLPNIGALIQAGIDPKTGLPVKMGGTPCTLKTDVSKMLSVVDEQDAIRRYKWYNLPDGLTSELMERILYYRYKGIFFYSKELEKFYFLPFTLDGGIDVYGRYTGVRPMPFMGSTGAEGKSNAKGKNPMWDYITSITKKPVFGVKLYEDLTIEDIEDSAVIITDYAQGMSLNNMPRADINRPLLNVEAECIPFLRTSLIANTGVKGMKVQSGDDYDNVVAANRGMQNAALQGEAFVPIVGSVDFQELTTNLGGSKAEEFMMAMQSLENFRLGLYGLDSGGVFEKKAHTLESEQAMNQSKVALVYQDGLTIRQEACTIINSIWGLSVWCEPSEAVLGVDQNKDGAIYDIDEPDGAATKTAGGTANVDTKVSE